MSRIEQKFDTLCEAKGQRDLDCAVSCRVTSPHHSGSYCLCWVVLWELVIFGGIHVFSHCMLKKAVSYIHSQATTQDAWLLFHLYLYRCFGISNCVVSIPVALVDSYHSY